jgi:hypothetical protein
VVLGILSCRVKLDEENPKSAGLAQENGFGSAIISRIAVASKRLSSIVYLQKRV